MNEQEEDFEAFKERFRELRKSGASNVVQYAIYIPRPDLSDKEVRSEFSLVLQALKDLKKKLLKDYIWERDSFELQLKREKSVWFLSGKTAFGESSEDEWLIVYLLRELSITFPNIWIRVFDDDGEFLLIEAADALPEWLTEDIDDKNRVWIHEGRIYIIRPHDEMRGLGIHDALKAISNQTSSLFHSRGIDTEAFYNIRNHPSAIAENVHHSLVTLPRKVAYLLHQKSAYISAAVEAFQPHDPIALRPLQTSNAQKLIFPPEDLVSFSVRFTRLGFARIRSQRFEPPLSWSNNLPPTGSSLERSRVELGMKITCGLEMLLSNPENQDKNFTREIRLLLQDLENGEEKLPKDEELARWSQKTDDDSWLDIKFEDLEKALGNPSRAQGHSVEALTDNLKIGGNAFQDNIRRRFEKFSKFIDDRDMDFEDSDSNESGDEGEDVEFDPVQYERTMREALGLPALSGSADGSNRPTVEKTEYLDEGSGEAESQEQELAELEKAMEAELFSLGALRRDIPADGLEHSVESGHNHEASDEEESNENVDIDFNLAKNMLAAFGGRVGGLAQ